MRAKTVAFQHSLLSGDAAMSSFAVHELRKKGPVILFRWRHTELNTLRIHLLVELLNVGHREAQLNTSRGILLRRWM